MLNAAAINILSDSHIPLFVLIFTTQCTLVQMRGLRIACRLSISKVGGL